MPRYGLLTTSQFIDGLCYWINIKFPDVIEMKTQEQIQNPGLFASDILRFKVEKNVEAVLEGSCSTPTCRPTVEFPLGKCVVREGQADKSWLHAVIDEFVQKHGHRPTSVLLYANCCGVYSEHHMSLIQQVFPDIVWHFPDVPDLYDEHYPDRLAQALLRAGYLEIVPATETS